jgi:hypothetical protein
MVLEDSAQERTGSQAGDPKGGGVQEPTIAEEIWLAMARNNRAGAKEIVAWLDLPPVVVTSYSFKVIESNEDHAADLETCQ